MRLDPEERIIAAALDEAEIEDANERGAGARIAARFPHDCTDGAVSPPGDERHQLKAKFDTILQRRKAGLDTRKRRTIFAFRCCLPVFRPPRPRVRSRYSTGLA